MISHVAIGILPCVKNTSLRQDASIEEIVDSDTLRLRSPCAPKFEERSQEETLHQEGCASRQAWDLAKHMYKNADKATFYSPTEARATPAPISKSPEEREFVADSGAAMHILSNKDLSSDELDTLPRSRNPTVVETADGEVQTNEEAQENVHDLDLFVTVQLLEETPAVLSLGKLCEDHGSPTSGSAVKNHG